MEAAAETFCMFSIKQDVSVCVYEQLVADGRLQINETQIGDIELF